MQLINLNEKFNELKKLSSKTNFKDVELSASFKEAYSSLMRNGSLGKYLNVEWAKHTAKITTNQGLIVLLPNFSFYIALKLSDYLEDLSAHNKIFRNIFSKEQISSKAAELKEKISDEDNKTIENYFNANQLSDSEFDSFLSYVNQYESWGGGKTIDRHDYYYSAILKAASLQAESHGAIADIAYQFHTHPELKKLDILADEVSFQQKINSQVIIEETITGEFVFKILNFLYKEEKIQKLLNKLILKEKDLKHYNLEHLGYRLTTFLKRSSQELSEIELSRAGKIRFFTSPIEINGDYYYLSNQWTSATNSRLDLQSFIPIFNDLYQNSYKIEVRGNTYTLLSILQYPSSPLPKPFLLLAGISGTGKTRFIREQAEASGTIDENYELVAVRPDWHEPSDLLGYISRLSSNGAEYITTDVVKFLAKAWRAIFDAGLTIKGERDGLVLTGEGDQLNELKPYWLCLDEMNLAPVEQYFSDYLSILETREWKWSDSNFTYRCDAVLKPSLFKQVAESNIDKLQEDVGLENHQKLWDLILEHGLSIPPNLIVAGTVNMDETTHGFSRKVIDRALSFDFGEFFPNDYDQFFEADTKPKALTFPIWSQAKKEQLTAEADPEGKETIKFLTAVNAELMNSPFELAYRALNELLLSVIAFKPENNKELQAVWDDFLMCKVLPRIEGDLDKLRGEDGILASLEELLATELEGIWSDNAQRKDLYRTKESGDDFNVACRSKKKLAWMNERLSTAGFTSFWP